MSKSATYNTWLSKEKILLLLSIDDKRCTIGVFIYLKRAFDTLINSWLLQKLKRFDISWCMVEQLFKRKISIGFYNNKTQPINICCGEPWSQIAYLYVNGIANVSTILKLIMF